MLRLGLPERFFERLARREYGPALTILWASSRRSSPPLKS